MNEQEECCEMGRLLRFPWWIMLLGGALLGIWLGARMYSRGQEIEIIATEE